MMSRRNFLGALATGLSLKERTGQEYLDAIKSLIEADERKKLPKISTHAFTKRFWKVVEPKTPFQDNWHIGCICEHLDAVSSGQITDILFNLPPGCMKLCADSTSVLTPSGWRLHGDLAVGDRVFGPDGQPRLILRTSGKAVADFDVHFSNGEAITCNGDHLWQVYDRHAEKWKVLSSAAMARAGVWVGGRSRFQLPDVAPVEFPHAALPLPAYFLGAWLGDGTSTKPCITHHPADEPIIARIRADGIEPTKRYGPYGASSAVATNFCQQGVVERLRALGVFDNKHIPAIYKYASVSQRIDLLAGLVDTDGWANRGRGRYQISTASRRLASDIHDVAASLGWRPYVVTFRPPGYKDYAPSSDEHFQVSFSPTEAVPVALDRKRLTTSALRRRVGIRAIQPARRPELGHCITIDRPDGLYLVGRTCIPTHNSLTISVMFPAKEWTHNPEYRYLGGSYDEGLQIRDVRKMRDIVDSADYQAEWPLKFARDQNTKTKIENEKTGWRIATSIGGKGTGEHPHRKLIDDPHNVKKSLSDKQRKEAVTWFDLTMGSRGLALNAATILTMQRLHMKDLSGHIMEQLREQFVIIVLPMRYEPPAWIEVNGKKALVPRMAKTPLGFQDPRKRPGELLFPGLFDKTKVAKLETQLRASNGEFGVAGQLQQRPVPQAGGLIKREWFTIVPQIPSTERVIARVRGWDCAGTEGGGDWTVGALLALCESGRVYIEHVLRGQWGPEKFEGPDGIFVKTVKADGRSIRQREEKEGGSAGKKVIHAHSLLIPGYDYQGSTAREDKPTRNQPFRSFAANGNVIIVQGEWNKVVLDWLCVFPNGDVDDDVDAISVAFNDVTLGALPPKPLEVNIG